MITHPYAGSIRYALLTLFVVVGANTTASVGAQEPKATQAGQREASRVEGAVTRGVALLLERQESLGSLRSGAKSKSTRKGDLDEWPYEGVYRVRGQIPIGYRIGGTAIAGLALLQAPGWEQDSERQLAVGRALDFVLGALRDERMTSEFKMGYDVRGWGHAYALAFLTRLRALERVPSKRQSAVDSTVRSLVRVLERSEIARTGGWNYSRRRVEGGRIPASTFMTAPTLQALFEAASQGEKVKPDVIRRALDSLEEGRLETGAFQYGTDPAKRADKRMQAVPGAAARMAVCESTLLLAGRGSVERLRGAVDAFFEHWKWLEERRQGQGTHTGPYGIAPYYFFYAHYYVAQAIELLPEQEREDRREALRKILFKVQEKSGGWNDRVFDRSEAFGTSMALLALMSVELSSPPTWRDPSARTGH